MQELTTKSYRIDELNSEAKQYALDNYETDTDFIRHEINDVFVEFDKKFKDLPEYELSPLRLRTWILNNYYTVLFKPKYLGVRKGKSIYSKIQFDNSCVLSGVCFDDDCLKPLYDFLQKPYNTDFESLLSNCKDSLEKCYEENLDYYNSDEFKETELLDLNYLFDENGKDITDLF